MHLNGAGRKLRALIAMAALATITHAQPSAPTPAKPDSPAPQAPPSVPAPATPTPPASIPAPPTSPAVEAPPAAPKPAPSPTPKQIAQSLAAAIEKSDVQSARALVLEDGPSRQIVESTLALSAALGRLDSAAATRFPQAQQSVSQNGLHLSDALKGIAGAQEAIDGDSATLTIPGQPATSLRLKRVAGKWLVDLAPPAGNGSAARRLLKLYDLLAKSADQTATEIAAGAHLTPAEAAEAFDRRVLRARMAE